MNTLMYSLAYTCIAMAMICLILGRRGRRWRRSFTGDPEAEWLADQILVVHDAALTRWVSDAVTASTTTLVLSCAVAFGLAAILGSDIHAPAGFGQDRPFAATEAVGVFAIVGCVAIFSAVWTRLSRRQRWLSSLYYLSRDGATETDDANSKWLAEELAFHLNTKAYSIIGPGTKSTGAVEFWKGHLLLLVNPALRSLRSLDSKMSETRAQVSLIRSALGGESLLDGGAQRSRCGMNCVVLSLVVAVAVVAAMVVSYVSAGVSPEAIWAQVNNGSTFFDRAIAPKH